MNIKTILVPTDFSEPAAAALAYARELAGAFGASIHVLHVIPDPTAQPWAAEAYAGSLPGLVTELKSQAQRDLHGMVPPSDRKKYRARLVVAVGAPFTRIIEYAKTNAVDLIVMGTHGRGALARAIVGSVTERIVRFAPCPVLAVRIPADKDKKGPGRGRRPRRGRAGAAD
jgi:nucleotide-binding universal stress UspA family protein